LIDKKDVKINPFGKFIKKIKKKLLNLKITIE